MAYRHNLSGLSVLATLLLAANHATAQTVQSDPLALEEVVVTATKRAESIQDVPMSVTAFTSEFFKDSGVSNFSDLENYTPSLKITPGTDSNQISIRIRGIGSVGSNVGIDPSVGTFIDGVYQGRAGMSIGDLIDIERIEILRGPQGTLYGKNTAAGAISIITKAPSPEAFESEVELKYNSDKRAEIHAMANFPLGGSGNALRTTGYVVDGDHLYKNTWSGGEDLNDAHKWGVKGRILFDGDSNPDLSLGEFLVTADYAKEDVNCCALAVIEYDGLSTLNTPSLNQASALLSAQLGNNPMGEPILQWNSFENSEGYLPPRDAPFDKDNYWVNDDIFSKIDIGGLALEWNKELDSENALTFINAWRHYKSESAYDGDFTAYPAVTGSQDIDFDQYSSEFRITSPGGETFDYQAGLYAFYSEMDSVGTFVQTTALVNNIDVNGIPLSSLFPNGTLNTDTNTYKTTSYAAFGQLIWNITDELSVTFGMRYTWEKKERDGSQITEPDSLIDIPPVAGPDIFYDESRTDDDWSPTLIGRYFFTPDIMTYASISRGFKSGGFNQRRELEGRNGEFDPEKSTNYEVGWKTSTKDRRLQLNGTLYYTQYDDFQAQAFDGNNLTVTNAGSMKSYGSELELVFVPIANMTAGSAIGYNKAEYDEFDNGQCTILQTFDYYYIELGAQGGVPGVANPPCAQDLAGQPIDNAPEWTVSSFVQYDKDLSSSLVGKARLEHNYIDKFFLDQDLDPVLKNDAVHLVNLRLTLSNMEQTWEAAIWGQNILDEKYFAFGLDIPVMGGYTGVVAPRDIYGITLRFFH
ncbi:MAG: TonB-dependent receptor [Halioglobus sp.]|nr:TonB-dependent receptor [Halioglobus sp.]